MTRRSASLFTALLCLAALLLGLFILRGAAHSFTDRCAAAHGTVMQVSSGLHSPTHLCMSADGRVLIEEAI